jgi:hypothetical protein
MASSEGERWQDGIWFQERSQARILSCQSSLEMSPLLAR